MKKSSRKNNQKNKYIYFLVVFILIIIGITGIYALSSNNQEDNKNHNIDLGDNFSFYDLNGNEKQLNEFRDKIVVLDMWATWCQPCQYQMLELEKAYKYYSNDKLEILSINIDSKETVTDINDFIYAFNSYGYNLDWVFGRENDNLDKYMPSGSIPTICIFDENGNLSFSHTGVIPFSEIPNGWPEETILLKDKLDELIE